MPDQFKLSTPPEDGISSVKFQPHSAQTIAVTSWDSSLRLYDISVNTQRLKRTFPTPLLDCCFSDTNLVHTGGLDCTLRSYDCNTQQESVIGTHEKAISKVHYASDVGLIITGSWDTTCRLWDPRSPTGSPAVHKQPDAVYTLDACGVRLVVGTAGRRVIIWDLRQMGQPEQQRESSLKYQTRCLRCFPNRQGYALSSIEGRVAVEFFDLDAEIQKKKYAFKCHRVKEGEKELIYPVNAIAFHQQYNTFATGGSDGLVNIWDGFNRKRLVQLHKFSTGIASLAFSDDGSALAIATSYMFEYGNNPPSAQTEDNVFIRYTSDQEVKPKHLPG